MPKRNKRTTFSNTESIITETSYTQGNQKVPQDKIHWSFRDLKAIQPLTEAQRMMFRSWFCDSFAEPVEPPGGVGYVGTKGTTKRKQGLVKQSILAYGYPGTGKTFLALYCALSSLLKGDCEKIYIIRSVVQSRNLGFLPGDLDEKLAPFLAPYQEILYELFGRKSTLSNMMKRDLIEFIPTSFLRGQTLNGVVIFDECQNTTWTECFTVLSRLGADSRIIICGDGMQCDLESYREKSSMQNLIRLADDMSCIDTIPFLKEDCVRSGFVKELLSSAVDLNLIE